MLSIRSRLAFPSLLTFFFALSCVAAGTALAASWAPNGIPVSPGVGFQTLPAIVPDGAGGAYFVWEDTRTNPRQTFAQHLTGDGDEVVGWTDSGVALPTDGVERSRPYAIPDGSGGIFVLDDGGPTNRSPLIVSHLTFGGLMESGWPIDGARITGYPDGPGPPGTACCRNWVPVAALGRSGTLFTSWTYSNRFNDPARVGALEGDGATSPGWAANGTYIDGGWYVQWSPVVAAVGDQDAFVVSPGFGDLVRRAQASGGLAPETYDPTSAGFRDAPGIVEDGSGGAFVFWLDLGFSPPRLLAQHLLGDLSVAPGWPANGLEVCTLATEAGTEIMIPGANTTIRRSSVATDGQGGAFVVWTDLRAGAGEADIYAQHLGGDGSLAWPVNGLPVCAATSDQRLPRVTEDGAGGILITWQDQRSGKDDDVYALRMTASGAVANGWPAEGLAVCSAAGDQTTPVITADALGNSTIAWVDARSGVTQIYATRVPADALAGVWIGEPDGDLAIQQIRPNPSANGVTVTFTLPTRGRAELEVIDLGGRVVARRTVEATRPGLMTQRFDRSAMARSGMYWIRLSREGMAVSRRACVVR